MYSWTGYLFGAHLNLHSHLKFFIVNALDHIASILTYGLSITLKPKINQKLLSFTRMYSKI